VNIIKGLDRIILVIAVISIAYGFLAGHELFRDSKTVKIYGDDKAPKGYTYLYSSKSNSALLERFGDLPKIKEYKVYAPPNWQCIIAGIFGAVIAFPVVLFGLRGIIRGTRWFFFWIAEGFKDEKK